MMSSATEKNEQGTNNDQHDNLSARTILSTSYRTVVHQSQEDKSCMDGTIVMKELRLKCSDNMVIAGQSWSFTTTTAASKLSKTASPLHAATTKLKDPLFRRLRILCLHGFLDNCRSFYRLAPYLVSHLPPPTLATPSATTLSSFSSPACSHHHEVVCIDFPGHGHSSHKSPDAPPMSTRSEFVYYVYESLVALGWISTSSNGPSDTIELGEFQHAPEDERKAMHHSKKGRNLNPQDERIIIIGHSLGAIIALQFAATFPEYVEHYINLDGIGPPDVQPSKSVITSLRQHVNQRQKRARLPRGSSTVATATTNEDKAVPKNDAWSKLSGTRTHPSIEAAIKTRVATASFSPGMQSLSYEAASEMVQRALSVTTRTGTTTVDSLSCSSIASLSSQDDAAFHFHHDRRNQWCNAHLLHYNNMKQWIAWCQALECSMHWFRATHGWPYRDESIKRAIQVLSERQQSSATNLLPTLVYQFFPGSHHFHADPETAREVEEALLQFLLSLMSSSSSSSVSNQPLTSSL